METLRQESRPDYHEGRVSAVVLVKEDAEKRFGEMDRDQDGKVSPEELFLTTWMWQSVIGDFLRFDVNRDGRVSRDELSTNVEAWRKNVAATTFPSFDTDGDGLLTWTEYRLTPINNPMINWGATQTDQNGDGLLDLSEFFLDRKLSGPLWLCGLTFLIFDRFDRNSDRHLDSQEYSFQINPAALTAEGSFRSKDRDQSRAVSWEELSLEIAVDRQPSLRQLFLVFDANGNQQLELAEFRALPDLFQPADRLVPDSVRDARDAFLAKLKSVLEAADKNHDGLWKRDEWPVTATLLPLLSDTAATPHQGWDFDQNGEVTAEELGVGADLAFGLIDPVERKWSWHLPNGNVFSGTNWRYLDKNRDLFVAKDEFLTLYWVKDEAEKRFSEMDRDHDGKVSPQEIFLTTWMWSSVVGDFLRFDLNLDGRVSRDELATSIEAWRKNLAEISFPGFDTNGDGCLTWTEYRLTPLSNPMINWTVAPTDRNGDGLIDLLEFWPERSSFGPLWMCGLMPVVFNRLDQNRDGQLDEAEFSFHRMLQVELTQAGWGPDPVRIECERVISEFRSWLTTADRNRDGQLSENEWPRIDVERVFPIAKLRSFEVWDANRDGRVSLEEFQSLLREAWGITSRRCPADWLRRGSGHIVDFATFLSVDLDRNGFLSRQEFLEKYFGTPAEREKWFKDMDRDEDGALSLRELLAGGHLSRFPWGHFQELDRDRDGKLSPQEMNSAPAWQRAATALSFPTFDDDGDGFLTPAEFRWTPLVNPVSAWTQKKNDIDHDGALSLEEFYTTPPGESSNWLVLLAYENFRRSDQNDDGKLTLDEYDFSVDLANLDPVAAFRFADKNHDGGLELAEVFLDANPTGGASAAVIDYHRRKMKSEEAFLGADLDGNRKLSPSEYAKYNRYLKGETTEKDFTPDIPIAKVATSWDDRLLYGFLGFDLLLALVGAVYWMQKRRAT